MSVRLPTVWIAGLPVAAVHLSLCSVAVQILPTTSSFDAVLYLALVHGDTEVDDLRRGCANLHMELSERTGQLKALVSHARGDTGHYNTFSLWKTVREYRICEISRFADGMLCTSFVGSQIVSEVPGA